MDYREAKIKCTECGWKGLGKELLEAKNPFDDSDFISGCPDCKSINSVLYVCEEKGCWSEATCGTQTIRDKYMRLCGNHYQDLKK